ncbi:hypothetical protein DFQ26_006585 [Actinomortierella ambigua]|nr:hypothetical protein DFQ26_006585 [Actinomortierella ambigua]
MYGPSTLRSQHTAGQRLTTYGSKSKLKKESSAQHPVLSHWERLDRARIRKRHEQRDGGDGKSHGHANVLATLPMRREDEDNSSNGSNLGSGSGTTSRREPLASVAAHEAILEESSTDRFGPPSTTTFMNKKPDTKSIPSTSASSSHGYGKAANNQEIFQQAMGGHDHDHDHDMIERFDEECDDLDGDEVEDVDEVLFRAPSLQVLQKLRDMRPSPSSSSLSSPTLSSSLPPQSTAVSSSRGVKPTMPIERSSFTAAPFTGDSRGKASLGTKTTTSGSGSTTATNTKEGAATALERRQHAQMMATGSSSSSPSSSSSSSSTSAPLSSSPSSSPLFPALGKKTLRHDANNPFLNRGPLISLPSRDGKSHAAHPRRQKAVAGAVPSSGDSPEVALGKRMSTIEITPKRLLAKQRKIVTATTAALKMDDDENENDDEAQTIATTPRLVKSSNPSASASAATKYFAPASPLASFVSANRHRDLMALRDPPSLAPPAPAPPSFPLTAKAQAAAASKGRSTRGSIPTVSRPTLQDLVAICDQWLCTGSSPSSSSSSSSSSSKTMARRSEAEREPPQSLAISNLPTFEQFVLENPALRSTLCKVGEASYSEVYTAVMPDISSPPPPRSKANANGRKRTKSVDGHDMEDMTKKEDEDEEGRQRDLVVLKVVPFLNQTQRKGPRGTTMTVLSDIYREVVMSTRVVRDWDGFMSSMGAIVVRGKYPKCFLDSWDKYKSENGTESVRPGRYSSNQLYCILFMPFGGTDLEHYTLLDWRKAWTILTQLALFLATREEEPFQFEHRDLHWGNILVTQTSEPSVQLETRLLSSRGKYAAPGPVMILPTFGIRVQVIDYTLARVNTGHGKQALFMDLEDDQELFEGEGDLQFDIYRSMQQVTNKDWAGSYPRTNVLWMHYLCKKLVEDKGLVKPKRRLKLMPRHQDRDHPVNNPFVHKDEHWFYDRVLRITHLLEKESSGKDQDPFSPRIQNVRQLLHTLLD